MSASGPLSPGAFAAFLQAKGRRGEGTNYYRKLEAAKKAKMGSKMYERKKMLKILKKHLTKLIMGVKGVGAAPDWQLAQMRVMMGRCPFRKHCRQNKAIDDGRVEEGARGYGGAIGGKKVLVPFRPGVRRLSKNNKAATAIQAILRGRRGGATERVEALRAVAKAKSAKKKMPSAALQVLSAAAPPPLAGPYPSLRAALDALGVPRGKALTESKLGGRNIKYGKTKKKLKVGNKNKA
eukprot:2460376-Prymnesium_polylepis.1